MVVQAGAAGPSRYLRLAVRSAALLAASAALVPAYVLLRRAGSSRAPRVARLFHGCVCRSLGIRVVVHGAPAGRRGTLFVSNHLSWVDIPVLGSVLELSFVAKSEVAGWGLLGRLADLQRTVYVERRGRASVRRELGAVGARLAAGDSLLLFAEGTSSDGSHILPFKSSLLAALAGAGGAAIRVQPVTIAYTHLNGLPTLRQQLPLVAWLGNTPLRVHFVNLLSIGRITAQLTLHEPVSLSAFPSRKALASHCRAVIEADYQQLMHRRPASTP